MKKINKKSIVIISVVTLIILIGVLLFFKDDKKSKQLVCSFSKNDYELIGYNVEMDAKYTSPESIDAIEGTIKFIFKKNELLQNIDYIESSIKDYYKKLEKSEAINIIVYKENNNLIVSFDIDYTRFNPAVLKNEDFIVDNGNLLEEIPSVESLKESTLKSGGVCVEK